MQKGLYSQVMLESVVIAAAVTMYDAVPKDVVMVVGSVLPTLYMSEKYGSRLCEGVKDFFDAYLLPVKN